MNPTRGVLLFSHFVVDRTSPRAACGRLGVPVAQLDKASDYESEDWGFKSLQGYVLLLISKTFFFRVLTFGCGPKLAWMPEGSKGADLRSAGRLSAWVRTPLQALPFDIFGISIFVEPVVLPTSGTASMA